MHEGEDEIAEDLNDIEEPSGPRTNLKVNADLDACLMKSSKPSIRGSLASGRNDGDDPQRQSGLNSRPALGGYISLRAP